MANASLAVRVPLAPAAAWFGLFMFSLFSTTTSAQEVEWLRRFGAAGYYDDGGAIATDATGIYVTGRTLAPLPGATDTYPDAFVRKFSFDGKLLWSRQFKIQTYDEPFAIAVDDGGVYIAGRTNNGAFVSRLTLAGAVVWSHVIDYRKLSEAWTIAVHPSGIYVGGDILGIDVDAALAKLDFDGHEVWFSSRVGTTENDYFSQLAVDDTGVYGVGVIGAADIRKFDFNGHEVAHYGDGTFQGGALALDATGLYVTAARYGTSYDSRIRKFDRSGVRLWDKALSYATDDLQVDENGLYVVLHNNSGSEKPQVAKYTHDGNFVWQGPLPLRLQPGGLALHEGALYVGGTAFNGAETFTDAFVAQFSPTRPPQLVSVGAIDGTPAVATLVHDSAAPSVTVHVRNAATGGNISQVSFPGQVHPYELTVVPDRNGNGAPELVLFGVHEVTGNIVAQVRDARSGVQLDTVGFDKTYIPRAFVVVPSLGGNGQPGFAVLGISTRDLALRAEVKDSETGASIQAISFGVADLNKPSADLEIVPDINGNGSPELAVLASGISDLGSLLTVKDARSAALISETANLGNYYCVRDFAVVPDVDGNGRVELATLLKETCYFATGRVKADLRDPRTGTQSAFLGYGRLGHPIALVPLPDFNDNGAPQLGVMALNVSKDKDVLSVKDTATDQWTHNVTFLREGYRYRGVVRVADINGNGRPEVAQLQERRSDGALRVVIKDALTGVLIRVVQ